MPGRTASITMRLANLITSLRVAWVACVVLAATTACAMLTPREADAADVTWNNTNAVDNAWSSTTNWSGIGVPESTDTATLGSAFASPTVNLDVSSTVASLTISTGDSFTLSSSNASVLTLATGGLTRDLASSGTQSISANVTLGANAVWAIDGDGQLVVSGAIGEDGGPWSLTKTGTGTLLLTGASSYSGGTTIDGGTIVVAPGGSISHSGTNLILGSTAGAVGGLNITGGSVLADNAAIGSTADSSGSVVITGGTLTTTTDLYAGFGGTGLLSISGSGVAIVGGTLSRGLSGTIALESGGTLQIGTGGSSGSLATDLTNNGSLVFNRSDGSSYSGIIDGSGTVTTLGSGTLTFTGVNTYTGVTTISTGALQLGDGLTTGSIAGDVVNDATLIFNPAEDLAFANSISGTGAVQKLGTAVLTLSGSNTYAGGTQFDAGVLSLGSADALGTSGTISFGGGMLQFTGSNTTDYSARFSTAGSQAFVLDTNSQDVALASALSGADSSLTKLGAGTLTISASNSYTGSTTINGGEAIVGAGGAISHSGTSLFVGTGGNTATLTISGGSVTDANAVIGSGDGGNGTVAVSDGTWITLGDLIVGASGSSVGTVTVSGGSVSNANATLGYDATAEGLATVAGGLWTTSGNLTVGRDGVGKLTVRDGGSVIVGGTLARGDSGTINLESGGTLQIGTGTTGGTLLGDLTNNGAIVFDRSDDSAYAGVIDGVGTVTKRGAGTLTLTGINTYTGTTTISAGALQLGLSTGSIAGNIVDNATLIFNPATDLSYAGSISGTGSLTKLGVGTLTLTGSSSYSGGTLINGGSFNVAAGGVVSHAAANLLVGDASTATLLVSGGSVTNADGIVGRGLTGVGYATVTDGIWTNTGGLQIGADGGTGLLTISGSGVVIVAGTLDRGTNGTIDLASGGTLQIGTGGTSGVLATNLTNNGLLVFDRSDDSTYGGVIDGSGLVTKRGTGTLTFSGSNGYGGGTLVASGTLAVAGGGVINHAVADMVVGTGGTLKLDGGTVTNLVGSVGYHSDGAAIVSSGTWTNAGAVRVGWGDPGDQLTGSGTGTLSITGGVVTNTDATLGAYAGSIGTAVIDGGSWTSSGDLRLGFSGGTGIMTLNDGSVTAANARVGSEFLGSGTLTVNGGSLTTIGSLSVGFDGGAGTFLMTSGTVTSGTSFVGSGGGSVGTAEISGGLWSTTGDLTVGGDGTGTLTLSGSGVMEVAGTLYRGSGGTITINGGGTLSIGTGGSSGSLATDITNDGLLVFNRATDSDYDWAISGSGAVTKSGSGTLTFTGSNGYNGGTTLENGLLSLGSAGALGTTGTITFAGGGLQFTAANTADYSARFSSADNQSIVLDTNSQTVSLASVISGSGSTLTKQGEGTLVLAANNTYTGLTTVSTGTLQVGDGTTSGSIVGNVLTLSTLAFNRSDATTYSGGISGGGEVVMMGSGTLGLNGNSSYTGGTRLDDGTLSLGSLGAIGSSGTIGFGGGTLQFTAANTADYSARFSTAASQAYRIDTNGQNVALASDLSSDGGSLTKLGLGMLTLSGSNGVTGGMDLLGGTLSLGSADALGTSGTISFGGGTLQFTAANTTDYSARFSTAPGQAYRIDTNGEDVILASDLSSDGGSLAKLGLGMLTLSGNNGMAGGVDLAGGTLSLGSAGALGSSGTIAFGGGTLQFTADNTTDYSSRFSTGINQAFKLDTNGQDVVLATGLSSIGGTLVKTGAGSLTLTGSSDYSGLTTITQGTLHIGDGGSTGSVAGNIQNESALVFNRSDDFTYAGAMSGAGSLKKLGGGVLTLSGSSGYLGGTQIDAGVLSLGSGFAIGSSGDISFGGGTLQFTGSNTTDYSARFSTAGAQTFRLDTNGQAVTLATGLSGAGSSLVKLGDGVLQLTGSSSYSGDTTIEGGTLEVTSGGAISHSTANLLVGGNAGSNGTLLLSGGLVSNANSFLGSGTGSQGSAIVTGGTWASSGDLMVGLGGTGTLAISGSGVVTVGGNLTRGISSTITLDPGGVLQIGTGGTGGTLLTDITNDGSIVFDRSDASTYALAISGGGGVTKLGAGTLTFTGNNSYTGPTTISAGALAIGDGSVDGSLVGDVVNNSSLIFNTVGLATYAGSLSGTGSVTMGGLGVLTLTGSSDSTGATLINAGVLSLGSANALGSAGTISFGGGMLQFTASGTTDYSSRFSAADNQSIVLDTNGQAVSLASVISGSGSTLTKLGDGTLVLAADNTYTGLTTVSAGVLQLGSGGTTGSIAGDVLVNAELIFNRSNDVVYAGSLSGTGAITKLGDGTVSLVGTNSFIGLATISAGTLEFGGGGTIVSDITNNSVLGFGGAGASEYAATISGSGAMLKSGAGTLTLSGTSTASGDITVAGGTFDVVAGGAINQPASVLYVAPTSGTATMSISGGSVTVAESYVGFTDNGAATISSGEWATVGDLRLGWSASGTLDVSGGLVTNRDAYVGSFDGGHGVATVTGGTWSSSRNMQVGYLGGTGTLTIANGGVVAVGGTLSTGTSGTINLNAGGTLQIGQGGLTGGLATNLVNNGTLIFNRSDASAYSGIISGTGAVTKQGAGTLTFAGANSYAGRTTISGGTLALSGSGSIGTGGLDLGTGGTFDLTALASGTYTLPSTGSLTGVGTLSGAGHTLAVLGAFQPGNSPGTVTLGPDFTLALALSSTSTFQITSPLYTVGSYDLVNGAGSVVFGGVLELDFSNGDYALGTNVLQLFANDGGWSGDFTTVHSTGLAAGQLATFNASTGYISIIPEPSSYVLAAIGASLVGLLHRRRRKAATARV